MKFPTMSNLEEVQNLENVEDNFKFLSSCIKNIEAVKTYMICLQLRKKR